jgi:hypothetical protein
MHKKEKVKKVYEELDSAYNHLKALGMINLFSLDTTEKRFEADIAIEKARARYFAAIESKDKLVREKVNET